MNSTALTRLTHAVMIVAALAAIVIVMPVKAEPAKQTAVVMLPRVVVIGKRIAPTPVVQLPRVVVTGHVDKREAQQAHKNEAPAKPAAVVVAAR